MNQGAQLARSNGDSSQQLAQLLVIPHSQLDVTRDDPSLLVVASSISSQLEDLCTEILQDCTSPRSVTPQSQSVFSSTGAFVHKLADTCCQVDRGASSDATSVLSFLQVAGDPANGKLQKNNG